MELSVALGEWLGVKDGVSPFIERDEFGRQFEAVAETVTANWINNEAKRNGPAHYSHSKSLMSARCGM